MWESLQMNTDLIARSGPHVKQTKLIIEAEIGRG